MGRRKILRCDFCHHELRMGAPRVSLNKFSMHFVCYENAKKIAHPMLLYLAFASGALMRDLHTDDKVAFNKWLRVFWKTDSPANPPVWDVKRVKPGQYLLKKPKEVRKRGKGRR